MFKNIRNVMIKNIQNVIIWNVQNVIYENIQNAIFKNIENVAIENIHYVIIGNITNIIFVYLSENFKRWQIESEDVTMVRKLWDENVNIEAYISRNCSVINKWCFCSNVARLWTRVPSKELVLEKLWAGEKVKWLIKRILYINVICRKKTRAARSYCVFSLSFSFWMAGWEAVFIASRDIWWKLRTSWWISAGDLPRGLML